ncbi:hypothetical protein [Flavobacterium sp. NKUCC04_CG]|uniref:hypothetical protein n=1 Tax=Flavobacterium sp. NKUCC04_CG TaxID=2842121 RepID=UPI001C5ACEBC|nr:hypothetical protein [Flavobacterium sp. NKUCC04_CG]MBW3517670.1 hypothetical protein [Flavobacterium sp. NKUCC04_CG]
MNNSIRTAFNLYLNGSVHVSLAVFSLVQMTFYFCNIPFDTVVSALAFFGTLFSYNFIKYAETVYKSKGVFSKNMKAIIAMSLIALTIAGFSFFMLQFNAQLVTLGLLLLCLLYAIPIYPKIPNLRNWAGIKIYIVSFCWAGVTLIVPIVNAGLALTQDIGIKFLQRFFLVLILILIFEIVDLQFDDKKLKTVPQTLGMEKTKRLIFLLLIPFYFLEFFKLGFQSIQAWNNLVIVALVLFFTWKASPQQTKYFTLFWVESVPIVWWLLIVGEKFFSFV